MSKDAESLICSINKITCVFTICLTFFLVTAHAEIVTTENNPSPRLSQDLTNPQNCKKDVQTASFLSKLQKQQNPDIETSIADRVKTTFSCLISVEKVHEKWKRNNNLLIDTRDAKAFSGNKILGSINLPLYMLKFKDSLQSRNIVLVNKGAQLATLEQSCQALKTQGFKQIAVLQDGMKAWSDTGYPITGDKLAIQDFSDLTPSELMGIITERDWMFIDVDHSSKALRHLISVPSVIEYSEDFASLSEELAAFKATRKPGVITGFLVISQDGRQNGIIKKQFQDFGIKDVYYLSGGVSGFKRFAQKHAAQVERLRKGFQVRMGCNG
ncbi:MAG: rhodanese-like domain-containing protein [Candidatus Thiodiazotropha endolucinida]